MRQSSGLTVRASWRLRSSESMPRSEVWNAMRATNLPSVGRGARMDLPVIEGAAPDAQVGEVLHGDDVATGSKPW